MKLGLMYVCLSVCVNVEEIEGKKRYDLVVIGGGSGGLACSKEGEYLLSTIYKASIRTV